MNELTVTQNGQFLAERADLSESARRYVRKSKAANTVRVYKSALAEFESFASARGESALPAEVDTVIEYLAALADAGASVSTIEVKIAAVAFGHRAAGHPDPTVVESVKSTMAGIRREHGRPANKRQAATLDDIEAMIATVDVDTLKGKRDKALLLVGFAGGFRRSELVALDVGHLALNGSKVDIVVQRSKTDQAGTGRTKSIPIIGGALCPVAALKDWLDAAGIASGPVFVRIDKWGVVHGRLSAQSVALVIKACAKAAGLDWRKFSGHSLRRGFVTAASDAGASASDIALQTWQSLDTLQGYREASGIGQRRAVKAAFGQGGNGEN